MLGDIRPVPDCFRPLLLALTDRATPTMLPSLPPLLTRNTITENLTNQDAPSAPLLLVTWYCHSLKQLIQIHYDYLNESRENGEKKLFFNVQKEVHSNF